MLLLDGKVLLAVFISLAFTWSGVSNGFCWSTRAAAALTTGVAMLVPLNVKYALERFKAPTDL